MGGDPFRWLGETLDGKYRIDALVGQGGFGVVYRAQHLGLGERVAVKCLRVPESLEGAERARFFESFLAEGRLLHQLSRSTAGIVQALDAGAATAPSGAWTPYLVMEWLEGRSLETDLQERADAGLPGRSLADAVDLLDPAARALAVAHEQGVAHRDIKPANLFLTDLGGRQTVKLLDFGIAKVITETHSISKAFEATGHTLQAFTAHYGAPEQFSRRFGATGPWTDVFALALVLVELVSGRRALDGDDAAQLFVSAADRELRPTLRTLGVPVPDAIDVVFARALAVDPKQRYTTVAELWDELLSAVAHGSAARPPGAALPKLRPILEKSTAVPSLREPAATEAPTQLATSSQVPLERALLSNRRGPDGQRSGLRNALLAGTSVLVVAAFAGYLSSRPGSAPALPSAQHVVQPPAPAPSAVPKRAPPRPTLIDVAPGIAPGGRRWLPQFRIASSGSGEQALTLSEAQARCESAGLGLCTENQWLRACSEHPDLASTPSWTISAYAAGFVVRGGEGCGARALVNGSAGEPPHGSACCERAVAIDTTNRNKTFLMATTQRLLTLESVLNQRQPSKLAELLAETVTFNNTPKPKDELAQLLERAPDQWTMLDSCIVEMSQLEKAVKPAKSRKRKKAPSTESSSWSAECDETRRRGDRFARMTSRYVFGGDGTLQSLGDLRLLRDWAPP